MGLRDRLEENARRLEEGGRRIAASAPAQRIEGGFRNLRELFSGEDDRASSVEGFLLALVRAVRKDEQEERLEARDVYVTSRKRRRRLGLMSFGAGPLIGVANQLADLYCETAIVCDVATLHGLELGDEQLAAHMLLLWGIVETPVEARQAIEGDPSLTNILARRVGEQFGEQLPEKLTKRSAIKALWDVRGALGDARRASSSKALRTVVFTGFRTKKVIKKAEAQLGVATH
jgi:hypothetical protein